MERMILSQLNDWKASYRRKPLLLQGARQVGKTWVLLEFAKQSFTDFAYINFLEDKEIASVLERGLDVERILEAIEIKSNTKINDDTLIIFDEIQECPEALTFLKIFYEKHPEIPLVAAGSLLGVALHSNTSFPVGKIDHLFMYPMSFYEYLLARESPLCNPLRNKDTSLMETFADQYIEALKHYYFIGGMPEAVLAFVETKDLTEVRKVHKRLLFDYEHDFSKHASPLLSERIRMLWSSVPSQLGRENKKFLYSAIRKGARARGYEEAIQWLVDAGLLLRVNRIAKPGIPLSAYENKDAFKLYMLDVGLLGAASNISSTSLIEGTSLFTEFKGALTENYVCQELLAAGGIQANYWSSEKSDGEVDFVYEMNGKIIPVEVKAELNLRSKSLRSFLSRYGIGKGYRLSLAGTKDQEWVENIPLYAMNMLPGFAAEPKGGLE